MSNPGGGYPYGQYSQPQGPIAQPPWTTGPQSTAQYQQQPYAQNPPSQPYYYPPAPEPQAPGQYPAQYVTSGGQGQQPSQIQGIPAQAQQTYQQAHQPSQGMPTYQQPQAANTEVGDADQARRRSTVYDLDFTDLYYDKPDRRMKPTGGETLSTDNDLFLNFNDLRLTEPAIPSNRRKSDEKIHQAKKKAEQSEKETKLEDAGKAKEVERLEMELKEKKERKEEMERKMREYERSQREKEEGKKRAEEKRIAQEMMEKEEARIAEEIAKKEAYARFVKQEEEASNAKEEAEAEAILEATLLDKEEKETKDEEKPKVKEKAEAVGSNTTPIFEEQRPSLGQKTLPSGISSNDFVGVQSSSIKRDDFKHPDTPPNSPKGKIPLDTLNGFYGEGTENRELPSVQEPTERDVSHSIIGSLTTLTPIVSWEHHSDTLASITKNGSRLNLLEGDYFYPYDRGLALKAEKVQRIGSGASGTVMHMRVRGQRESKSEVSRFLVFARKFIRIIGSVRESDADNEIRAIQKLCTSDNGQNLVQVFHHESGSADLLSDDIRQIDMELCTKNLRDEMKSDAASLLEQLTQISGNISSPESKNELKGLLASTCRKILGILSDILRGLEFIHIHSMVHRDLKPENILFSYIHRRWKIADFGTTTEGTSRNLFHTTSRRGTDRYRAPELLGDEGVFNSKTDIWAVGCIIYEICTKQPAFSTDWATMKYVDSGGEPCKSIFRFPGDWTFEKQAKWISDSCVAPALQLPLDARPSATELLKGSKEIIVS